MDFFRLIFRFIPEYKGRITAYVLMNFVASVFSVFSFIALIPLSSFFLACQTRPLNMLRQKDYLLTMAFLMQPRTTSCTIYKSRWL